MDIDTAGMALPGLSRRLAVSRHKGLGQGSLDTQIAQRKAACPQSGQQLVAVVLQGLQPGAGRGPNAEHSTLEPQRTAMGGELGPGDARPGLPQGCQMPPLAPAALQSIEAIAEGGGRSRSCRQQHGDRSNADRANRARLLALLGPTSSRHRDQASLAPRP